MFNLVRGELSMRHFNVSRFSLSASVIALGAAGAAPAFAQAPSSNPLAQAAAVDCSTIADAAQRATCVTDQGTSAPVQLAQTTPQGATNPPTTPPAATNPAPAAPEAAAVPGENTIFV